MTTSIKTTKTARTSRFFTRSTRRRRRRSIVKSNLKKGEKDATESGKIAADHDHDQTKKIRRKTAGRAVKRRKLNHTTTPTIILSPDADAEVDNVGSLSCENAVHVSTQVSDLSVIAQIGLQDESVALKNSQRESGTEADTELNSLDMLASEGLSGLNILPPAVNVSIEVDDSCGYGDRPELGNNEVGVPTLESRPPQEQQSNPREDQGQGQRSPRKSKSVSPRKPPQKLSPYFPKPLPLIESSCLPFPPISATSFGLIQEQLALSPFRLLIATIFLNRTRGPVAIPVLFELFARYPTIEDMAGAKHEDIVSIIHGLGFQNQRATKFIALARKWLQFPPERGKRYRKLNYPCKRDGADIAPDEVVPDEEDDHGRDEEKEEEDDDDDESQQKQKQQCNCNRRVAWEIAHLPGVGAYAIDSWRIFCRDRLRYCAAESEPNEPEWKRVLPQDKELRAYLSWMWLKEGWVWNCEDGSRTKADSEMMKRAEKGDVAFESVTGHLILMNMGINTDEMALQKDGFVKRAGFSLDCS